MIVVEDSCPHNFQFSGDLRVVIGQAKGKFGSRGTESSLNVSLNMCMSGCAHKSGCMDNGSVARAAN